MVGHVRFALWSIVLGVLAGLVAPAGAGSPPLYNRGLRWIGLSTACVAPSPWSAERLFRGAGLPPDLADFCLYTWTGAGTPAPDDHSALATGSRATELTEDVPVLYASGLEEQYYAGLRSALRSHVGGAWLLPSAPPRPAVRIAVVDTAPDAPPGAIQAGTNRHGDTLAHLIEELVCVPTQGADPICAAEVTTVLALPWLERGVLGPSGGNLGTLADLARAIERAVGTWQQDKLVAPASTPERLILNLSLGWEHTPLIADCTTRAGTPIGPPARAVQRILQHTASQGVLVIAAAGNDAGGPTPRTGLVCPGAYQALAQPADPAQPLLTAVSGLDYRDRPLATARPLGTTGIAGIGLGGVAWQPSDPTPPQLTGSSVATAVVSAVSAVVWAARPAWAPTQVTKAVYDGGVDAGTADACPLLLASCRMRRASACGALVAAGVAPHCTPAPPQPSSSPSLPAPTAALATAYGSVPPGATNPVSLATIPRNLVPGVQLDPWTFPTPISAGCRTCMAGNLLPTSQPSLLIPERDDTLTTPVLVVELVAGDVHALDLGPVLLPATPYLYPLPTGWVIQSAFLTGFDAFGASISEQIFVQP